MRGFESIFGDAKQVHIVVSEEAATYRPEMEWLRGATWRHATSTFTIQRFNDFADGDAVYRFFELFDLPNVPNAKQIFELAAEKKIRLTPPPKPMFEEKMLFALLWNRNLQNFWRQELGEGFLARLKKVMFWEAYVSSTSTVANLGNDQPPAPSTTSIPFIQMFTSSPPPQQQSSSQMCISA